MTIVTPKPGLYKGISYADYDGWAAARASVLQRFRRSAAHARYAMLSGGEDSPSLDLGWLFHLAVLEPEVFKTSVAVGPVGDRRFTHVKKQWAEFEAAHPGAQIVSPDAHRAAIRMRDSLMSNETAHAFFTAEGGNEVSFLWEDPDTGAMCKGRVDRVGTINEAPIIGELKSAANASHRAFERAIEQFGYHVAAAHYTAGLEALFPMPAGYGRFHMFFVVENEEPYCTAVYQSDDDLLIEGERVRTAALRQWAKCKETGIYPGYPQGVDTISLPSWALKNYVVSEP